MVSPCSDSESHSAEPKEKLDFNFEHLRNEVLKYDYELEFDSELILLFKDEEYNENVALYPSGKILYKTSDTETAENMHKKIVKIIKKVI